MMKKYLLKGKDFLMKKLDELEIQRGDIDYISEQIPRRLLDKLRVLDSADYDLEPASQYANYFRTYPNHPISPLLAERMKEQKPLEYSLNPKIEQQKIGIPEFDEALQKKALTFKGVVDSYDEGLPQLDTNPLICICVVNFHHKRGSEIEYRYPSNETVEKIENTIVHNAMPDSSHNKSEDFNFFNFEAEIKGKKRMLFGVSSFKQIKLTEAMKAKNEQLTRSHMQKAVCVISLLPVFGYLKTRILPTTKLFFANFTNFQSIKLAYCDISKHLSESWPKIELSELYNGSDLRRIIEIFKYRFFQVYKAILQLKRVVVFSHSSSSSSSFILSLLSLFPGMITFGMQSAPINRYLQGLREYALPLKLFSSENPLILSFHIQDFHLLQRFKKPNVKGNYLIGTTNRLVKESKNIGIQVLVNLQTCSVEYLDTQEIVQGVTKQQKAFIDDMLKTFEKQLVWGYQGSDDWIRDKFHHYLKTRLVEFVDAKNKYLKFAADCRSYSSKRKKSGGGKANSDIKEYQFMEDEDDLNDKKKDKVPEVDQSILNMPFIQMLGQSHFMYFLQFHNPNISLLTELNPTDQLIVIDNHEYYLGSLPKQTAEYIVYNIKTRKLRFGNPQKSKKVKELKFDEANQVIEVFVGMCDDNKHNGPGYVITESEIYQGDFQNNQRNGFGKLVTSFETYIGNFLQGLYNGEGQLVSTDGVIYSGLFKEGVKEGQGRLQKVGFIYEGDFHENQMSGKGNISYDKDNLKVFGQFIKGKLDESQQCVIKYSNGDAYAGFISKLKPNGKGTLRKAQGEIIAGQFEDGELKKNE